MGLTRGSRVGEDERRFDRLLELERAGKVPYWPVVLTMCVVLIELVGLMLVPTFETNDGPAHVGGAASLLRLLGGDTAQGQYLTINWFPAPNISPDLILMILVAALGPHNGEKAFLAGYVLLLPIGLWYALSGVSRAGRWLVVFALPLTFTLTLNYGFYNFSVGVIAFVIAAGYFARHREPLGLKTGIMTAILLLLTYSAHVVPYLAAGLLLVTLAFWDGCIELRTGVSAFRAFWHRGWRLALASAPSFALLLMFIARAPLGQDATNHSLPERLGGLLTLFWPLVTWNLSEVLFTIILAITLAGLALAGIRRRLRTAQHLRPDDAYLLFAFVGAAIAVAVPNGLNAGSGGGLVQQRMTLFPIYGALFWLGAQALDRNATRLGTVGALAVALGLAAIRLPVTLQLSDLAEDFRSVAPCLARGSTMVQSNLWKPLDRADPLIAETGRISGETNGVDLGNINAEIPLFLYGFLPSRDPYRELRSQRVSIDHIPPAIDPLGYEQRTGGRVDYVLVYGREKASPDLLNSPGWSNLSVQLASGYRLVATSPKGLLEVWERKASPAAAAGSAAREAAGLPVCLSD